MISKFQDLVLEHVFLVERLPPRQGRRAFHCRLGCPKSPVLLCPTRKSDSMPFLPGSGPSIHLCMNERKTQVKTKGFYSKNAKYKKKIRSFFPCTVFHSDKTSRLHAAQTGSGRHVMPAGTAFLCTVSNAPSQTEPRPTPVSRQGAPPTEGTTAAVPPESLHPSKHCSPPQKVPKSRGKKKKQERKEKKHDNKTLGNSQWKLGTGREPNK